MNVWTQKINRLVSEANSLAIQGKLTESLIIVYQAEIKFCWEQLGK